MMTSHSDSPRPDLVPAGTPDAFEPWNIPAYVFAAMADYSRVLGYVDAPANIKRLLGIDTTRTIDQSVQESCIALCEAIARALREAKASASPTPFPPNTAGGPSGEIPPEIERAIWCYGKLNSYSNETALRSAIASALSAAEKRGVRMGRSKQDTISLQEAAGVCRRRAASHHAENRPDVANEAVKCALAIEQYIVRDAPPLTAQGESCAPLLKGSEGLTLKRPPLREGETSE